MREILFRGKTDKGEWVQGAPFFEEDRCYIIEELFICDEYNCTGAVNSYVHPKTVGQFTGLTDKNGKKIFEGDIVDCWSEGVNAQGTVQQRRDGLWIIYPAWQKHIMWGLCPDEYSNTTVEVIGNVHDNPELIKT